MPALPWAMHRGSVAPPKAVAGQQEEVLEVPLAPAPVPFELVEECRGGLLVASLHLAGDPDFPAGSPHERGLDEIVAQDLAAKGWVARQA